MTALYIDDLLPLSLVINPVMGISMSDIIEVLTKEAAYIEVANRYTFEDEPLEFYFCNKNGAYLAVDDKSIRARLTSRDSEPGEPEYAIYRIMGALDLLGEIEEIESCFNGVVRVSISHFPSNSDVCGGTP